MKFPKFFLEVFNQVLSKQRCIDLVSVYNEEVAAKFYPDIKVLITFSKEYDHFIIIHQFHSYLNNDFIIDKEGFKPCPDQP